jgi:CRP/FNR family transcriptional regulator
MQPLCQPHDGSQGSVVECRRRIEPGESVYATQVPRASLLALRAGSLRASMEDRVGGAHILRFIFPGEAAGLGALSPGAGLVDLVALEAAEVCVIPVDRAQARANESPAIAGHLRNLLCAELARAQAHATQLARLDAAARVARYLLDHAREHAARGLHGALPLPMGRRELGEHLNLTIESTSRILRDFHSRGWIRLGHRSVAILRPAALEFGVRPRSRPATRPQLKFQDVRSGSDPESPG